MTALAKDRNTPVRASELYDFPAAADAVVWMGALVVLNAGNAEPGTVATGLVAVGRAEERVDNTGGSAGGKTVKVRPGVFRYQNSAAADEIDLTHVGSLCYIVDDQTVAATDGTGARSAAGVVRDVDAQGVWVEIRPGVTL